MTYKKLIIIIISIITALLISIVGLVLLYKFKPELIGLTPNKTKLEATKGDNKQSIKDKFNKQQMNISLLEFNKMQSELIKNAILKFQNKEMQSQKNYLYDSLKAISNTMKPTKDSLIMMKDSFQISRNYINYLNDSLNKLSALYNSALTNINTNKTAQKTKKENENIALEIQARKDSIKNVNLMNYAKIYNSANPQEVASILDQLNEKDAAYIIKNMNKKKAARVLEKMHPESVAAIMLLGI